ncbi:hypothetical protein DSO57_1021193 [Entomophthora muscae]|uniref:Uncharacterized protein n=1 Tax=Entomophthora muscae TaxID=34485 RepID=A0ACC2U1W4_9FUNG|nr:hypothetical protein DSO57_1021193 [Entomophthora muscae]
MEPPVTPKIIPASLPDLPTEHTGKLFGIVYITLTGVIDTIVPVAGLWSWVGKSVSYLFKLAPLLWWALPNKTLAQVTPETTGQPPETGSLILMNVNSNIIYVSNCWESDWLISEQSLHRINTATSVALDALSNNQYVQLWSPSLLVSISCVFSLYHQYCAWFQILLTNQLVYTYLLHPFFETMKGSPFMFWFLVLFLSVVLALENPTPTTDWHHSSPDESHQKESLENGWFKYPSGHWGRKLQYGRSTTLPPPAEPSLVRPNASFYMLSYLVGYYLLGHFSHLAMIMVPIGSIIAGLNLGALAHQIGNLFLLKWVPDRG